MYSFKRPDQIPTVDVHAVGEFTAAPQHTADTFFHGAGIDQRDLADPRVEDPFAATPIAPGDMLRKRKITIDKLADPFDGQAIVAASGSAKRAIAGLFSAGAASDCVSMPAAAVCVAGC